MRISDWSSDVCSSDLEADRRIGAIGIGPEILPYARLRVEIGSDRAAVEDLDLGALDAFAENPFAFALEREPIDIAPYQPSPAPAKPAPPLRAWNSARLEVMEAIGCPPISFILSLAGRALFAAGSTRSAYQSARSQSEDATAELPAP